LDQPHQPDPQPYLDFQSPVSNIPEMQKFKVNDQSVPKIEWKQMDGQMGGWTDRGDLITCRTNAVGNNTNTLTSHHDRIFRILQFQIQNTAVK